LQALLQRRGVPPSLVLLLPQVRSQAHQARSSAPATARTRRRASAPSWRTPLRMAAPTAAQQRAQQQQQQQKSRPQASPQNRAAHA
jgi:hypothetical protein